MPPGTTVLPGCHTRVGATGKGTGSWCPPGRGLLVGLSVMKVAAMLAFLLFLLHPHDAAGLGALVLLQGSSIQPCSHPPPPAKARAVRLGFNPSSARMGSAGGIYEPGACGGLCVGKADFMAPWVGLTTPGAVPKPQGWSCPAHVCSLLPPHPRKMKMVETHSPTQCPRARPVLGCWLCPPILERHTAR